MKLKTLKEMVDYYKSASGGCLFVSSNELRQDAIKWIKQNRKVNRGDNWEIGYAIETWIVTFFNLTEKDLEDTN